MWGWHTANGSRISRTAPMTMRLHARPQAACAIGLRQSHWATEPHKLPHTAQDGAPKLLLVLLRTRHTQLGMQLGTPVGRAINPVICHGTGLGSAVCRRAHGPPHRAGTPPQKPRNNSQPPHHSLSTHSPLSTRDTSTHAFTPPTKPGSCPAAAPTYPWYFGYSYACPSRDVGWA
jgi:hypothetical protein